MYNTIVIIITASVPLPPFSPELSDQLFAPGLPFFALDNILTTMVIVPVIVYLNYSRATHPTFRNWIGFVWNCAENDSDSYRSSENSNSPNRIKYWVEFGNHLPGILASNSYEIAVDCMLLLWILVEHAHTRCMVWKCDISILKKSERKWLHLNQSWFEYAQRTIRTECAFQFSTQIFSPSRKYYNSV